jgi:FixJ family two-component response regulator
MALGEEAPPLPKRKKLSAQPIPSMNTRNQIVYIVDDDKAIRDSLAMLLETEGLRAKGFGSAAEFLAVCGTESRGCLLLDINMPHMSGMELQRRMAEFGIAMPVIFLTGAGDVPLASQAFRGGALDFLEKPFDVEVLLERVHQALSLDSQQWHNRYRRKLLRESCARLSPREKQVLKWVAAGYSSKEIAKVMDISNRTVEGHRAHIMEKLNAQSLADLISVALELDMADPPERDADSERKDWAQ